MTARRRNVHGKDKAVDTSFKGQPDRPKSKQTTRADGKNAQFVSQSKRAQKIKGYSYLWNIIGFIVLFSSSYFVIDYFTDVYDNEMAPHDAEFTRLFVEVPCSEDYGSKFKACAPKKCGRCVMDNIFDAEDIRNLKQIAEKGLALGGSNGGASILDLHSGAFSKGDKFANIYRFEQQIFNNFDFDLYRRTKNKIQEVIAKEFNIPKSKLYLTYPTFFSRMDSRPAKTKHDEYWHPHIDKITYKTFYYTSLLYLSEYGEDFMGGRFKFIGKNTNKTVEPRRGRLSFFTSGAENPHFVEPIKSGTRFAITVSFTCDPNAAIKDPGL